MASTAIVRLGPSSASLSRTLADAQAGDYTPLVTLRCAQVPADFNVGSTIWIWLGSDNNKGQATDWVQGIRALGECQSKVQETGTRNFEIVIGNIYLLPRTIEKAELLQTSPETYAHSLSNAAIIGLNNYSSQVVQLISDEESATIAAVIATLLPAEQSRLRALVPAMQGVQILPRTSLDEENVIETDTATVAEEPTLYSLIPEDDPIYQRVKQLLEEDLVGGVLLVGAPGTGKSWYASQIAIKLTQGIGSHIREVQFHPAYQYEDFVEGYVPDSGKGFRLVDKHLLVMADLAKRVDKPVVLVIDEFSRTDPSRVLGEAMTYMESSFRGKEFRLPSGRCASIPKNLIFLATMNPEDRSVEEIDAAMERRWAKVHLAPDPAVLGKFLRDNGADDAFVPPVIEFFVALQEHMAIGHAFFRSVRDADSLTRLWESQLVFAVQKKFRFDAATVGEIEQLWSQCVARLPQKSSNPASATEPVDAPVVGAEPIASVAG